MESLRNNNATYSDKLQALESENILLREQLLQLQQEQAMLLSLQEQKEWLQKQHTQSEARFRTIFYQSKLGNKIIDANLNIIQVNPSLLTMLRYHEEELVGIKILEITHPECVPIWRKLQHSLWNDEVPSFQMETRLKRKDGVYIWVQVTSIRFEELGKSLGYTIIEDISERKRLDKEFRQLYESQETMMHIVAHDLKNPLISISIANTMLKNSLSEPVKPESEQELPPIYISSIIEESCQRGLSLIEELLFLGELKSNLSVKFTNLKASIVCLLPDLQLHAQKKEIQIHFDERQPSIYAMLDTAKFSRALSNLLSNAIKFTPRGGQVFVSLREEQNTILVQIRDTGIGIPEALQDQIFDRFTKVGRTGTEQEKSTGLGLYIAKEIVELHGGKIWVESKENQGTSFYIKLQKQ